MRLGQIGLEHERLPIRRNGFVVAAERLQGVAAMNVRGGPLRLQHQQASSMGPGLIGAIQAEQRIAAGSCALR